MFASTDAFVAWLRQHAGASLADAVSALQPSEVDALKQVYVSNGELQGDMLALSGALGKSVAGFVKAVQGVPGLTDPQSLTAFVVDNTIGLFRLMDRGVTGDKRRITGSQSGMPAALFPGGDIEGAFVRPLAEQAVEKVLSVMKG